MELVLLIVLFAGGLAWIGRTVIAYRANEMRRAVYLDLRCQDVIRDFQRKVNHDRHC